jgi:hypothetical protein
MSIGELVKRHSLKSVEAWKGLGLFEAEVVSGAPDVKIKLKGNDKLIVPKELLVVAEHLCRTTRKAHVKNAGKTSFSSQDCDGVVGPAVPVNPPPPHAHTLSMPIEFAGRSFRFEEGDIHYLNDDGEDDLLRAGDLVMAFSFEGGQRYFVFDRIVRY